MVEEAHDYASERKTELERQAIREQNVRRKKEGLAALKLPPKYKKEEKIGTSNSKRARDDDAEESDHETDVEYEGRMLSPL